MANLTAEEFVSRFPQAAREEPMANCLVDKACPKCGSRELAVQAVRWVAVFDDGTDDGAPGLPNRDTEFDENSPVRCRSCGHDAAWGNFSIDGLDDALADTADADAGGQAPEWDSAAPAPEDGP
jgi:DNA-directed RNA polymerase subunit RPC12/RpoP